MEYKVLKNKDIDKQRWDACVNSSKEAHIYALSWYLDVVCPTWQALVFGDYEAVFPICKKYKWGVVPVIKSPHQTKEFSLYLDENKSPIVTEQHVEVIKKLLSRALITKVYLDSSLAFKLHFKSENNTKQIIDFSNYGTYPNPKLKRKLNNLNNYTVKFNLDKNESIDFLINTIKKRGFIKHESFYEITKKLYLQGISKNTILNAGLYFNDKLCAVIMYGINKNTLFSIMPIGNEISKSGGMYFLFYTVFQKHIHEISKVDFMGSNVKGVRQSNNVFANKEINYSLVTKYCFL